jgi:hypothetical protein
MQDNAFIGNDAARGPWSADACHAGPVTGVIARALEGVIQDKQLVRLTLSFNRPLPMAGFSIEAAAVKTGRETSTASATARDADGRVCASATSLHLAVNAFDAFPTVSVAKPVFADARVGKFVVQQARHGLPFFGNNIEVAYPPGESGEPGPTTMWMRAKPIVQGETPTPFQSVCPIADCGNGIGRNAEFTDASFINADLTIIVYRPAESEWLASSAKSFWEPTGIGMSQATLFDTRGAIGAALQTLIVRPTL